MRSTDRIKKPSTNADKIETFSSSEMIALYRGASASTRFRDIRKMLSLDLIRFSDNDQFIEEIFQILESLQNMS
jgi:hypothetical protein